MNNQGAKTKRILAKAAAIAAVGLAAAPLESAGKDARATYATAPLVEPRTYQMPIWSDHETPLVIVEMGRQLGKSFTLASWAVDQILMDLEQEGRTTSLVTVLSNSKANGQEFALKAAEAARRKQQAQSEMSGPDEVELQRIKFDEMRFEIRITVGDKTGRILVLAANPRTARGFSGHLILDEFAFHQDAAAIWEAAEPIISSRTDYLCRIASTHNGKRTLFYQMARGGQYPVYAVKRSEAWRMGQGDRDAWAGFVERWKALEKDDEKGPDHHPRLDAWMATLSPDMKLWLTGNSEVKTFGTAAIPAVDVLKIKSLKKRGRLITPEEAEAEATDRRAYRQNYENEPGDDGGALIGAALIQSAERNFLWSIDEQQWSEDTLQRLYRLGDVELYVGQDVGRSNDLSAVSVIHKDGQCRRMVALLIMRECNLAHQRRQMEALITTLRGRIRRVAIDFTGIGTGLCDELKEKFGSLILPVAFGSTVPLDAALAAEGRKGQTMRITERMGLDLLALFEDGHIEIKQDAQLRDDLRRPGRVVAASGMVSIAAERNKEDHSDRFWSLALAEHAILSGGSGTFTADQAGAVMSGGGGLFGNERLEWGGGGDYFVSRAADVKTPPFRGGHSQKRPGALESALHFLKRGLFGPDRTPLFHPGAKSGILGCMSHAWHRVTHYVAAAAGNLNPEAC